MDDEQFERWWKETGCPMALEIAKNTGDTIYEPYTDGIKLICHACWDQAYYEEVHWHEIDD